MNHDILQRLLTWHIAIIYAGDYVCYKQITYNTQQKPAAATRLLARTLSASPLGGELVRLSAATSLTTQEKRYADGKDMPKALVSAYTQSAGEVFSCICFALKYANTVFGEVGIVCCLRSRPELLQRNTTFTEIVKLARAEPNVTFKAAVDSLLAAATQNLKASGTREITVQIHAPSILRLLISCHKWHNADKWLWQ